MRINISNGAVELASFSRFSASASELDPGHTRAGRSSGRGAISNTWSANSTFPNGAET